MPDRTGTPAPDGGSGFARGRLLLEVPIEFQLVELHPAVTAR